ncbi:hypothetical protein HYH03_007423 [Edaphochlamys debaryana]|uniref:Uncharacterized protein n=1 Tax=Edaphochlamys debaryana TaxID=47281 RepID=A0A836BZ00_9CHLO|nr:hypothetical protein HYH03_007423 [Edaphochlamys debaryana]|eukprot:KAG2494366.1 hypothetical protein HYH03_007423 [Edaphochlamys debaryana]
MKLKSNLKRVKLVVHVAQGVNIDSEEFKGREFVAKHMLPARYPAERGQGSMASATLAALDDIANSFCPGAGNVLLASGTSVPVKALSTSAGNEVLPMLGYNDVHCHRRPSEQQQAALSKALQDKQYDEPDAASWAKSFACTPQFVLLSYEMVVDLVAAREYITRFAYGYAEAKGADTDSGRAFRKAWGEHARAPEEVCIGTYLRKVGREAAGAEAAALACATCPSRGAVRALEGVQEAKWAVRPWVLHMADMPAAASWNQLQPKLRALWVKE